MGEVYRARDTRLKREVALKILPESFAADPERLARFQREAEVLASLDHPNIAGIYGLEETDGTKALVMQLVEGETLAERIARGPIHLDEALPLAKQIAEALEAAHEHRIIHRDLKPANIKITPEALVKVLDFGLAKLVEPAGEGIRGASSLSMSPTITSPALLTSAGVLLGTAAYMSPEQAKGRSADKRSDVWAFACVLFEMLAGRRAFAGQETAEVLARVLTAEPPWSALPASVPPTLLAYLRRCFHKDPRQRLRDIGDFRLAMDGAFDPPPSHPAAFAPRSSARRWRYALLAVGVALIMTLAISLGIMSANRPLGHVPVRFSISLPPSGWQLNPNGPPVVALSPDGRTIVYAGRDQLYRRDVGQLESVPVPGTTAAVDNINTPFFSPDGRWVGFFRAGALRKVALEGGAPTVILEAVPRGASWGLDDTIVFGTNAGLMRVSASGGDPEPVTSVADGEVGHYRPDILPNGKAVLFTIWSGSLETAKVAVASLGTRDRRTLFAGSYPRYTSTGHIVFVRESSLWAVPFDVDRLEVTGRPVPILDTVLIERASGVGQFAIANNGNLVYATASARAEWRRLVWVSGRGTEEPLELEAGPYSDPSVSPDGTRVAMTVTREDNIDIWVWHVMRKTFERFTFDPGPESTPLWSVDGGHLVFQTATGLSWKPLGTGGVERLLDNPNRPSPAAWTSDGRLIFNETAPAMRNIGVVPLGDRAKAQILLSNPKFYEQAAALSPDGRWLAYQSDESGNSEIYVRPFPDVDRRTWQVSAGGGAQPKWSPDGRELYYRTPGNLMVARIQTVPGFSRATPEVLFSTAGYVIPTVNRAYDVAPNGRFLLMKGEGNEAGKSQSGQQLIYVQDWFDELLRLVPAN
jgi:serine/threonine-protein kinase